MKFLPIVSMLVLLPISAFAQPQQPYTPTLQLLTNQAATCEKLAIEQYSMMEVSQKALLKEREGYKKMLADAGLPTTLPNPEPAKDVPAVITPTEK